MKELEDALNAATTRYTRDRGEPDPTPAIPFEVVFTMAQWERVRLALKQLRVAPNFPYDPSPTGTNTVTSQPMPNVLVR